MDDADSASRLRILVADDDATVRRVLEAVLGRVGHRVTAVATVDDARVALAGEPFDVALVDARMPGDGVALRRELEAGALNGRTILMTGDAEARAQDADAEPLLPKPFNYDAMVQLVEFLGRRGGPD